MRIKFIDAMRGFTMFLVVFGHVLALSFNIGEDSVVYSFFRTFRMPAFFFISGFIGYKALPEFSVGNTLSLLRHKAFVQLVPTVIFYSVYQLSFGSSPLAFFDKGLYGYWFTLVIFELFVLYYSVSAISLATTKTKIWDVVFALSIMASWAVGLFLNSRLETGPRLVRILNLGNFFLYLPFFSIGLFVKKYKTCYDILTNRFFFVASTISFILLFILKRNHAIDNIYLSYMISSFLLPIFGLSMVFNIFNSSRDYFEKNGKISRLMQYVGRRTLDVYLLHYFFLPVLGQYKSFFLCGDNEFVIGELFIGGIMAIMVILVCLIISNALRKSDILAKYCFGVVKK